MINNTTKGRNIWTIIILILSICSLSAQIPNGGFESWVRNQNVDSPLHWETNQDSTLLRFEKDSINFVEGKYAIKINPCLDCHSFWGNCQSYLNTSFKFLSPLGDKKSLTFYAKSIPEISNATGNVYLFVGVRMFKNGVFKYNSFWSNKSPINEFTKIQIPLLHSDVDSLVLTIAGGATDNPADGCMWYSTSWIDGLSITDTEVSNTVSEHLYKSKQFKVFPNPSKGMLEIDNYDGRFSRYFLFSIDGRMIEEGSLNSKVITFRKELKGMFFLRMSNDDFTLINEQKIILE